MDLIANGGQRTRLRAIWAARWLRALICATCMLAVTSCAPGTMATRPAIPAELLALLHPIPPVDASLTMPCSALPLATDDSITTLLRNHAQVSALYHQCAGRADGLAAAARQRERIETERIARAASALQSGD